MRPFSALAGVIAASLLAACQPTGEGPEPAQTPAPETTAVGTPGSLAEDMPQPPAGAPEPQPPGEPENSARAALPLPGSLPTPTPASPVPHIYMALQPDGVGMPVSAIFAIDAARDNTPSDDPAIRLTPENGLCNPQEMRSYSFPAEAAAAPVVSEADQAKGLTVPTLPAFMAVAVTDKMLATGLATDREQTRALNICTRKLWEELVLSENQAFLPTGQ
jgi:hypothetical protein